MNRNLNILNINEIHNSLEGKKDNTRNVVKLINNHYSNSLKTPFSNLMLRKTIIRHKIKTLNKIKQNITKKKVEHKKMTFKQNNLYINFSDFYEQNKQKAKDNNNINNSFDENNVYKNIRNNDFSSQRKLFKSRNIKHLKLPTSKTIHNLKFKFFTKELKDKRIVYINNQVVKINRMNITINNTPKHFKLDDKTIQLAKRYLPKIEETKNYNKINNSIKNLVYKNNNNTNKIKSLKTAQISQYLQNTPKVLFKNRTNNEMIKPNEDNYKSVSAERNNYILNDYNYQKKEKINTIDRQIKKEEDFLNIIPLSFEVHNQKKNHINIFTLLSLKNKSHK